jgi:hypothetical protein
MSDKSKFAGCFKFSCFGCLAVFALVVGLILLAGAIQLTTGDQEPDPQEREASHVLPEAPEIPVHAGGDRPEMPDILPMEAPEPPAAGGGTVVLNLSMGQFTIEPGPAGEPIRVEADYDSNAYNLVESYVENDDGTWTYDVKFGGKGGILGAIFRGADANRNRVKVVIPRGHPVDLIGKIGMGESEADLGGLWLRQVDLRYSAGEHFLEFREPLAFPMESFQLDSSMGSLEVRSLGEASPRLVTVEHGMGELLVDLGGTWRRDAQVDVSFSMGECRLWLPKNARIDIVRASVGLGEKRIDDHDRSGLPEDAPLLTLSLSGSMGELRIED